MYAFRCKNCGHLEAASHAGENLKPHACAVCSSGVSFNPKTGAKVFDISNWEILASCTQDHLLSLGLDGQVERHIPFEKPNNPVKRKASFGG